MNRMKSFARPGSTNIVNNVSEGEVEDIGLPEFNNSGKQRQGGRWVWIYCEKKHLKKTKKKIVKNKLIIQHSVLEWIWMKSPVPKPKVTTSWKGLQKGSKSPTLGPFYPYEKLQMT